jgi:O-antigen ligase
MNNSQTYHNASLLGNPARALAASYPAQICCLLLLHIPIGLLVQSSKTAATIHALFIAGLGLFFLRREQNPRRLIYVMAYMVGAEPLWRLRTVLNYEYDKYAIGVLLILALFKYSYGRRLTWTSLLYFVLLLPAIFVARQLDREVIVYNLAGPALLAIAACFFSMIALTWRELRHLLLSLLLPIIGLAAIAVFRTVTTAEIEFVDATNPITSGAYGGNQISAVLGLGAVVAFMLFTLYSDHRFLRLIMLLLSLDLLTQSAFTFARGGFYTAVGTLLVLVAYSVRNPRQRFIVLFSIVTLIVVGLTIVLPALNTFTGGALVERLQSTDPTGRDLIAQEDLRVFWENPIQGVGLGESIYYHIAVFRLTQPHTEPTRMLAEHGLLGLFALLIWFGLAARRFLKPLPLQAKTYLVVFMAWSIVTTLHIAMRLAAPGFLFGLGAMALLIEAPTVESPAIESSRPVLEQLPAP